MAKARDLASREVLGLTASDIRANESSPHCAEGPLAVAQTEAAQVQRVGLVRRDVPTFAAIDGVDGLDAIGGGGVLVRVAQPEHAGPARAPP